MRITKSLLYTTAIALPLYALSGCSSLTIAGYKLEKGALSETRDTMKMVLADIDTNEDKIISREEILEARKEYIWTRKIMNFLDEMEKKAKEGGRALGHHFLGGMEWPSEQN